MLLLPARVVSAMFLCRPEVLVLAGLGAAPRAGHPCEAIAALAGREL